MYVKNGCVSVVFSLYKILNIYSELFWLTWEKASSQGMPKCNIQKHTAAERIKKALVHMTPQWHYMDYCSCSIEQGKF